MTDPDMRPHNDGPIGYLVPEFPSQTHAFFWRELTAMEEAGATVQVFSTRRPPADACPHAFRAAAVARTDYLFPPRIGPALGHMLRHPAGTLAAAAMALRLPQSPWRDRLRVLALLPSAATLAAACRRAGIGHVHIHSCANSAYLGLMGGQMGGPSYSLTLHGDLPVYGRDHPTKMGRARFVSAVTRALAADIARVSPGTPAPVIWMGVDTARFCPAPDLRGQGGPFTVVTVARLNRMKGHVFFLRAMATLVAEGHDIRYRIAGEGPERGPILAEIARLGLTDRVEMLGSIDEGAVLTLLQSADALALTSTGQGEAAPVAVMEAMACGLPAVVSIIGGTPDMITDGRDGFLVPQEDVTAITAAFRQLLSTPGLPTRIATAARETALRDFDHRQNAALLLAAIRA